MQRTEAWYRQRRGKLTASALGQAVGLTPWGSPKRLAADLRADRATQDLDDNGTQMPRCEELKPKTQQPNVAMRWGTDKEPNGLLEYMIVTGQMVDDVGFVEHATLDWFGGSPDGLVNDDGMVEIKCPYSRKCYSEFPPYYYLQINALLEITGRAWCDLFVWTPESHKVWRVMANKQAFDTLLPHYTRFWACVQLGREPPNPAKVLLPLVRRWLMTDTALLEAGTLEYMRMLQPKELNVPLGNSTCLFSA